MAVIGSIRKHSTFLVIIIGAALAAFILGDFAKKRQKRDINVGKVNGEEIAIMDFNNKVDQNIDATKQQQKKSTLTSDESFRIRNETWDQMVKDMLMNKEYDELGIDVTTDELFDLIQGPNPYPLIKKYFVNRKTGKYDRRLVINYLKNLDRVSPKQKQQWITFEEYIKNDTKQKKFNTLIQIGYYVPKILAKMAYNEENDKANIEFEATRYPDVPDSLVKVTDADYQHYFDENKKRYEQKESRSIDFVLFNVKPSIRDTKKALKEAVATKTDFENTPNIGQFVRANSDAPYDSAWKAEGQLPVQIDSLMFHSKIGTVSKPYLESDSYYIARLVDIAYRPDSMKASHILIAYKGAMRANPAVNRTKEEANKLADSLYRIVKRNPRKITKLADKFSDDGTAKKNHGNLGWFADGHMIPTFNKAVFDTKVGHVTMVESPFGFHIIKVTGKKRPVRKVKVAIVKQEIIPSNETYQSTFAKASKLASENKTAKAFYEAIRKDHLHKRTMPKMDKMSNYIVSLKNPRQIVKWAFNEDTKVGEVSKVFDLEGQYVVAVLTEKFEKGYPSLDDLKPRIVNNVMDEVKGRYLVKKMKTFDGDFAKIAATMKVQKEKMTTLSFNTRNMTGFGREKKVVGYVFGMDQGKISRPLIGNGGVFVIHLDKMTKASDLGNYSATIKKMESEFEKRVTQNYPYKALKNASDIVDNRISFY